MNARTDLPWSEQFRLAAKAWVELDKAANMLEESKSAVLAQRIAAQGDVAYNRAEMAVKASPEWHEYIKSMVDARSAANLKKVQMEYLRMKFTEWNSDEANKRSEKKL